MSKWAEVTIQTRKTFAVLLDDDETIEDARQYALNECTDGDSEVFGSCIAKNDHEAERIQAHADEVID